MIFLRFSLSCVPTGATATLVSRVRTAKISTCLVTPRHAATEAPAKPSIHLTTNAAVLLVRLSPTFLS